MIPLAYSLAAVPKQPATLQQLAGMSIFVVAFILFSTMGIIDGLVFRRVRFRYGPVILNTFRGVSAQLIGVVCIFTALFGVYLVVLYATMLGSYCKGNTGCFVTTPMAAIVDNWVSILAIVAILFGFFDWVRKRRGEVAAPTDKLTYSLPSVYRHVNAKLAVAREPAMNRPEVEQIMAFVDQHAPFVVLSGAKQVMDGRKLNHNKLATVFLTDERFRKKGPRERIALEAVTEAYVAARQPR